MARQNVADVPKSMMKIVVAEPGKYLETMRIHAGSDVAVMPDGYDWTAVTESDNPLEAIFNLPIIWKVCHAQ